MLAKITSELGKPAGLVVLSREQALERFAGDSPGLVPGIGPKTVARLERMGIADLADPARVRPRRARGGLRAADGRLAAGPGAVRGRDPDRVSRETKSQSTEITFDVDVADHERLAEHIRNLAEELCRRLRSRDLEGRTIGIKVRLDDWTNVTRSHTVERADQRPRRRRPRRPRPAARLRPAAPRAAARRPDRRVRRRGARTPGRPSRAQLQLGVSG